ncbi:hypothetical protein [Nocardioides astragali]|uniref:Lipoprotein n=1 Tax=Nocardioides astragali TaxID=1776736 RepID=A0ABW2N4R7_9ACTN|nr:hypothetical protein [Nocardioides astragali]
MTSTLSTSLRRSGARTRSALVLAAGIALSAGLTGCGSDGASGGGDDTATDPAPSSSTPPPAEDAPAESPTETSTPETGSGSLETIEAIGSAGVTEATLLSATEAGGAESTLAFALDTDQARADFGAQFEGRFGDTVSAAAVDAMEQAPDSTTYGATVSIGCDAPRGVAVEAGEAGFEVIPRLPKKGVQCLAPVTYVVLFNAPNA